MKLPDALCLVSGLLLCLTGCTPQVRLVTPEPVKVDVNMKVEVTSRGTAEKTAPTGSISGLSEETRRRHRVSEVNNLIYRGVAGIDRKGMLAPRPLWPADNDREYIERTISEENTDRLKSIGEESRKSGKVPEEVQREFVQRIQDGAPPGTWIEIQDDKGQWMWKKK